jgi:hypothetical protein
VHQTRQLLTFLQFLQYFGASFLQPAAPSSTATYAFYLLALWHEDRHSGSTEPAPRNRSSPVASSMSVLGYGCVVVTHALLNEHTPQQPSASPLFFPCTICDSVFTSQVSLNQHTQLYHSANPPLFTCDLCDGVFAARSYLIQYTPLHH